MTGRLFASIAAIIFLLCTGLLFAQSQIVMIIIVISITLMLSFGIIIQRHLILPIKTLTTEIQRLSNRDYSPIPHHNYIAELGNLAFEIEGLNNTLNETVGMSESMLENIMTPMVVVGPDGNIRWLNESIIRLIEEDGKTEDFIGQDFSIFFYGSKQETVSEKCMQEKKQLFVKGQVDGRKGTTKYISVASSPIFDFR